MREMEDGARAFSTFRVLNGDANTMERDQLFRNMAQLYSYVSDRCDDEQVSQYDEVLCQLAELVEVEARTHVAKLLAPLERAPGNVVVRLANDTIEVAAPLLEFSNVLSDDDLIDIVTNRTEGGPWASGIDFLQMRGTYTVEWVAIRRRISFTAPGAVVSFTGK